MISEDSELELDNQEWSGNIFSGFAERVECWISGNRSDNNNCATSTKNNNKIHGFHWLFLCLWEDRIILSLLPIPILFSFNIFFLKNKEEKLSLIHYFYYTHSFEWSKKRKYDETICICLFVWDMVRFWAICLITITIISLIFYIYYFFMYYRFYFCHLLLTSPIRMYI